VTLLCVLLALSTALAWCSFEFYRNRAANLELHVEGLRDEIVEIMCKLDDAQREAARLRTSNAHLIRENSTLLVDLEYTERACQFYRSRRRRNRELAAGWLLTDGWARPQKKANVQMMESSSLP
jgi:hypothetical protein